MSVFWLPDEEEPADLGNVIKAAEALIISEYDFFHLAFRRWKGCAPEKVALEETFADYMFHQTVPPWVRHLAREVLSLEENGTLDIVCMGAHRYQRGVPPPKNGRFHVGIMAAAVIVYCFALVEISHFQDTTAPLPCNGGPGLMVISKMAYAVSEGRMPPCGEQTGG